MPSVISGHTGNAGKVMGVHGGEGAMLWTRFATGAHLYGDWDGIEWVAFEPGGRAGLHTHSHTEEIWFILRGTAEIELDGEKYSVEPGSIVVTPLHSRHALWNTGGERIEYIVIEVFPPEISEKLPVRRPTEEAQEVIRAEGKVS
ncbi:cupin domain-containing protein [Nocardia carnea]|uniref:cupin domain-containing protein n=1 Tax=Nocardia carnea TaxID=37328 RepID=UPI002458C926|nr:cupin domain-containing protein [Nocardia carnea]